MSKYDALQHLYHPLLRLPEASRHLLSREVQYTHEHRHNRFVAQHAALGLTLASWLHRIAPRRPEETFRLCKLKPSG